MNNAYKTVLIIISLFPLISSSAYADVDIWAESYRLETLTRYEDAAKVLSPMLGKKQQNEFAMLRHGWLNYLRGNHNDAIDDYKTALGINAKSLDARLGVMLPLLAQQRWREAVKYAQEALEIAPWNYYAHVRLMIAEEGQRQWQTLAKHAQQVHLRYPSDATVLVYLARANRWLGNNDKSKQAYELVLQRVPGHIEALQFVEGAVK